MSTRRYGRYVVELTNPEKRLFPDGITKADVVDYYERVADVLLPYAKGRPLTLRQFPDGVDEDGFYQQSAPDYFPDWIDRVEVGKKGGTVEHVMVGKMADLAFLANQGVIELHAWQSRAGDLGRPDRLIFDLDPPDADEGFDLARRTAFVLKELLDGLGLASFVKTTGSKGLHVVCPIRPSRGFDSVRAFARSVSELLAVREPDLCTTEQRKEKRGPRVYLDTLRNSWAHTAIAPYSLRALPGAPVATPIEWDELNDVDFGSRRWRLSNLFRRLGQKDDPWKGMGRRAKSLSEPAEKLASLRVEAGLSEA